MLLSIQALLSAPNPDDPLANDVAEQWKSNEAQAIETGDTFSSALARLMLCNYLYLLEKIIIYVITHVINI